MNEILKLLLNHKDQFISGEEIARHFGLSRNAIWKKINHIREKGFEIESYPKKGYRIHSIPENLLFEELILQKGKTLFPSEILVYEEIDSTNLEAKRQLNEGRSGDFLILANKQTRGKGRLNRVWENEAGKDIALTLILDLSEPVSEFYRYVMMVSVVLRRVFEEFNVATKIKWPNDLYVDQKKICGILSEMQTEGNMIRYLMIGIGINVNSTPKLPQAISIQQILEEKTDRHELIARFLDIFAEIRKQKNTGNFDLIYQEWKSNMNWMGKEIRIDTGQETLHGILSDVNPYGGIILKINGEMKEFYSGDIMGLPNQF